MAEFEGILPFLRHFFMSFNLIYLSQALQRRISSSNQSSLNPARRLLARAGLCGGGKLAMRARVIFKFFFISPSSRSKSNFTPWLWNFTYKAKLLWVLTAAAYKLEAPCITSLSKRWFAYNIQQCAQAKSCGLINLLAKKHFEICF